MQPDLRRARAIAARSFPPGLYDTQGRFHPNGPRIAIRAGHWDGGSLVRAALVERAEEVGDDD